MRPGWQPGAIAVTLYEVRDGPAVDLQIEPQVPSEVWHSVNNKTPRHVMLIRPKITGSPLCNSSDANCADKTKSQQKVPREAVFRFHDRDHTLESFFRQPLTQAKYSLSEVYRPTPLQLGTSSWIDDKGGNVSAE